MTVLLEHNVMTALLEYLDLLLQIQVAAWASALLDSQLQLSQDQL